MKIAFVGAKNIRRVVGPYCWSKENAHQTEVPDAALCANLLTEKHGDFSVAADEPLLRVGLKEDEIIGLAMFGICTISALALLNKSGISALALATGKRVLRIRAWVRRATLLMEALNHE